MEAVADEQALVEIEKEVGLCSQDVELIAKGGLLVTEDEGVRWVVHSYLFHIEEPNKVRIDWEHSEKSWIKPQEIAGYDTVPILKEALARVYKL